MRKLMLEMYEYETPDGEIYQLHDMNVRVLQSLDNLGQPDTEYRTSRGPYQDGETVKSRVYRPRIVTLVHRAQTQSRDDWWTMRAHMLDMFRCNRQNPPTSSSRTDIVLGTFNGIAPGILRVYKPDGNAYKLYVYPENGPSLPIGLGNSDWDDFAITDSIRLIAFDPLWYANEASSSSLLPANVDELVFPIDFPIEFGYSYLLNYVDITYLGTYRCYPKISVRGPASNFGIRNETTLREFTFGYDIPAAKTIVFDLTADAKLVYDGNGNNYIGSVSGDIGQFTLEPAPYAAGGVNRISIVGTSIIAPATRIDITYTARYTGI